MSYFLDLFRSLSTEEKLRQIAQFEAMRAKPGEFVLGGFVQHDPDHLAHLDRKIQEMRNAL